MLRALFTPNTANHTPPQEGDLYKVVECQGKTFEIRYGYYEEIDRQYEPVAIYPDFLQEPMYTGDGIPFATQMQDVCPHYSGSEPDDCCGGCDHFQKDTDLFGLCTCKLRRNET